MSQGLTFRGMRTGLFCLAAFAMLPSLGRAQAPVFTIATDTSSVTFYVKASVSLTGTFKQWDSTLTFTSTDISTGVLDIKIQADSVSTGSGMKDGKLKSKEFFNVKDDPYITFKSTKIVQTGPTSFEVDGDFTIRGVTKPEKLTLELARESPDTGVIKGTMAFDRRDYGMTHGIPFVTIADRIEVTVDLKGKRISGPPLALKQ